MTSFRVGYITINPFINEGYYDVEYLNRFGGVIHEDKFIRHVRFENPLEIKIDGKSHKGIIMKPGKNA
jgi:hypothetical protein